MWKNPFSLTGVTKKMRGSSLKTSVLGNAQEPSKNYLTVRGGKRVDNFVTYRYVYLRGRGVLYEIVT